MIETWEFADPDVEGDDNLTLLTDKRLAADVAPLAHEPPSSPREKLWAFEPGE